MLKRAMTAKRSQLLFDAANALVSVQVNLTTYINNPCHVLLIPPADNLRDRPHNRQLPDRMSHLTNVILLFECCFVTVIDCMDCIQFLSSCILSVHVCLQLRSDVTFDLDLEHVLETFWDHCVEVGFFLIGLLVYFFNRV